jgi:hypothetical protein
MSRLMDSPFLVFLAAFVLLFLASRLGIFARRRRGPVDPDEREDLGVVIATTLSLLGLIIGFTFSMAIGRYDQRKNLEEEEANAIGTEYLRAELLPAPDAAKLKALLVEYLDVRIAFYRASGRQEIDQLSARVGQLQTSLWESARTPAAAQPSPLSALVLSGANDVINAQGYAYAARRNRIPVAAWTLLFAVALGANLLVGYGVRRTKSGAALLMILPLLIAVSFFLIADIDSPRGGIVRIRPQNLVTLAESLRGD